MLSECYSVLHYMCYSVCVAMCYIGYYVGFIANSNEISYNGYKFWTPISYSNFEAMKLVLGLVAVNNYRNTLLIWLKYCLKY